MEIKRRHYLKKKELKKILEELRDTLGVEIPGKVKGELVVVDKYEVVLIDGEPTAFKVEGRFYPTLHCIMRYNVERGRVVVDMGAVKFLAKGADVMAPGIVDADESIKEGDIVFAVDETHNKPLIVGRALMDGATMKNARRGRAIKTLHHVGDPIWNLK
ncbi:RNA-binding protein [Methanothermococcus sp. SCGC AD-155-E23]|nr:RNA-binding protein [Methanothermococcus sp. SCGC AD-155-E23]